MVSSPIMDGDGDNSFQRTSQACERCRVKRVRCSGDKPCARCLNQGEACSYGYPRGGRRQSILTAIDEHINKSAVPNTRQTRLSVVTTTSSSALSSPVSSRSDTAIKSETPDTETSLTPFKSPDSALSDDSQDDTIASPTDVVARPSDTNKSRTRAKARKTRISSACLECKKRRRKCTGERPCQTCVDFQTKCVYDPTQDRRSRAYFQKRFADGVLEASQLDQNEELMDYLRKNADIDTDMAKGMEAALQLADQSPPSTASVTSSVPSRSSPRSPSATVDQKCRHFCTKFCGLTPCDPSRASWYPTDLQKTQLNLLAGPEHLILPHIIDDSSPLSKMYIDFRAGVAELLRTGTTMDEVLGPLDPVVDLLFRKRESSDPFSASTWACELTRLNAQVDLYTQLANTFLLARYMRWILAPTLENFMLLPEIMRPTISQKTIPHYPSADLYSIPAVRDSLIRGDKHLLAPFEKFGTASAGSGIRFCWPFDLDKAVDRDTETGTITISPLLAACAGDARCWSCSWDFLANTPMGRGVLNVVDHQHGWN